MRVAVSSSPAWGTELSSKSSWAQNESLSRQWWVCMLMLKSSFLSSGAQLAKGDLDFVIFLIQPP